MFREREGWIQKNNVLSTKPKKQQLSYVNDPTFSNNNRTFVCSIVQSYKNDPKRNYFDKYYMTPVEIKDFNVLINKKPFFYYPIKNKQDAYEKLVEISANNDYTIGNVFVPLET